MLVLVTSGPGYIGSHVVRQMAKRGYKIVVYDNLSRGHRFLVNGFECVIGSIGEREKLARALRGVGAVMHFAAFADVEESVKDPRKYFENNVVSGLALMDSIVEAGIRHFIFSSSCAVYGLPWQVPIAENAARNPTNPYGASKLAFEHVLEAYSNAYGLRFVSLRYFNAAGADESGEVGELHNPETHLIPRILEGAAGVRDGVEIFGTDYRTADGTCVRDYIHVNDLADAHVLALEYLLNGGESTASNLGSGAGYSVLNVVSAVEEVTGHKLTKHFLPRRPGDPPVLIADSRRAYEVLHWNPSRSLREIIATAWKWMRCRPMKYSVDRFVD